MDTLLIALYVEIDDHVVPARRRAVRPGAFGLKLSDAELVCLAVAQVLLGFSSQHHWLRFCASRLGHLFGVSAAAARLSQAVAGCCGVDLRRDASAGVADPVGHR
ncbi:hypothetical protein IW245_000710 [Longispora fulva]|uniref:Transposase n=1 Tax=Longispora fulva TaxID=619741 RepID=A0A8J7GBM8_9ACTN|nr:hypothetical protein [Longispora fulva]